MRCFQIAGYTIYFFELTPVINRPDYVQTSKEAHTDLHFNLTVQPGTVMCVYALGFFQEKVWINKNGGVLKSYAV